MIRRFFRRNRKLAIASTAIISLLALSVCVVCIYNSRILAGVFQAHKNEDGTVSYVEKNKIEVLEIVAQDGQQVLGYTVEGSEPIKPEQIASYTGSIDHDEFLAATGYDVTGTPGNYTVNSSHNNTFNDNVLSGGMFTDDDSIIVNSVTASSLTEEDIADADLIYINSGDNDENLLYYYDQIVNNGRNGIVKGDKGQSYAGTTEADISVKELAVDTILKAAGRPVNASLLNTEVFEKAEVENYKDYNIDEYINGIGALDKDSLTGVDINDSISKISSALSAINSQAKNNAITPLRTYIRSGSVPDEEKDNFIKLLKQREYTDFYEVNAQAYIDRLVSTRALTDKKIENAMSNVNKSNYTNAVNALISAKTTAIPEDETDTEEETGTDETPAPAVTLSEDEIAQYIAQVFYNNDQYISINSHAYAEEFLNEETVYTLDNPNTFVDELLASVISIVNDNRKDEALTKIASLTANKAETDNLKADLDAAKEMFELAGLDAYKEFNITLYLDAIGSLSDADALTSQQPDGEDGGYIRKYDVSKINNLLTGINNSTQKMEISCDMSWAMAMKVYEYITVNGRALVYNTELLTGKTIGDYTNPNDENNGNSVYKMLLVLRQMRPDYFRNTVLPKIDAEGNYTDGSGTVNGKWYAGTFCSAWNNEAAADKNNFREPAVVGKLYDEAGNQIGDTTYINDNIFSYTGQQFLGGKNFYVDTDDYNEVVPNTKKGEETVETKKTVYIDTSSQSWWTSAAEEGHQYVYCKLSDGTAQTLKVYEKYTQRQSTFWVDIPDNTTSIHFFIGNITWGDYNRTTDINTVAADDNGTIYKLNSYKGAGGKFVYKEDGASKSQTVKYFNWSKDGKIDGSSADIEEPTDRTKGEIIRDIMGISINQLQSMPFRVLEIQPTGAVNEFNSYAGAVKLASYLRVDLPDMTKSNYTDYFDIESISIREFNTRNEELADNYDLIYFGIQTGLMASKEYSSGSDKVKRAVYGSSTVMGESYYMNGLVYTGIGQQRQVGASLRGTVADDYVKQAGSASGLSLGTSFGIDYKLWTKYFFAEFSQPGNNQLDPNSIYVQKGGANYVSTRLTGNDLTVLRMNDLLDYVKAGYPVMFADEVLNADNDSEYTDCTNSNYAAATYAEAVKWRYVDKKSKLYAFIQTAKNLGKDTSGEYTDASAFGDGKPYASLISVKYAKYGKNPDKLTASEKFNGGLSFAVKRNIQVDFTLISGPQEYDKDTDGNELTPSTRGNGVAGNYVTDMNSCKVVLKPNVSRDGEWLNNNYEFHFYIDKSGTANFPDEQTVELDVSSYYDAKNNQVTVTTKNGKWPTGLEGFIPWKIVAVSKHNPGNKWSYLGYSAFYKNEADVVNVLWVSTQANSNGAVDGTTLDFRKMIYEYEGKNDDGYPVGTDYIPEYDIKVDKIYYGRFYDNYRTRPGDKLNRDDEVEYYTKATSLLKVGKLKNVESDSTRVVDASNPNPEYDMIVFGYCDSYYGLDLENVGALKDIDYFVNKAGHSLMFAHDNASYITSVNYYTDMSGRRDSTQNGYHSFTTNFARNNTAYLRGMIGMDNYGSSFSPLAFDSSNTETTEKNLSWLYIWQPSLFNARSYITSNPANPTTEELSDMRGFVDGQLLWYSSNTSDWPFKSNNGTGSNIGTNAYQDSWITTKGIECTNKGQIAMYPFIIGDSLTIDSETHFQYTRLDLEDEDTTVWYTLSNNGGHEYYDVTKGDGSNNYYIYSKGNVTYTGAGHRHIDDDAVETFLFVNTVVAAIKLGNFAPDVTFPDAVSVNNTEILYGYETDQKLKVTFKATDYDAESGDKAFNDAVIFLDKDNDGVYDSSKGDVLLNVPNYSPGTVSNLRDVDGNIINIDGTDIENRKETTFYLDFDYLASVYDSAIPDYLKKLDSGAKAADKVNALFEGTDVGGTTDYQYKICVSVLSTLEEERAKTEEADISDYYQSGMVKAILRSLYDLR